MSSWIIIIISIVVFMLLMIALYTTCPTNVDATEGWVDYQDSPYGNVHSGAGNSNGVRPLVFYNYPIYRRPLNWPVCHLVDYPVPHCRSDSL
jgi:hypothetical protein